MKSWVRHWYRPVSRARHGWSNDNLVWRRSRRYERCA